MNTLILGGVPLNSQMVWTDRKVSQGVAQSVLTTLGGSPVVYSQALIRGQSITLESQDDRGWLTTDQVNAIAALADQPGAQFELQINSQVFLVIFRHQESPAFQATPLIPRLNEGANDRHTATIKLMTI